MAFRYCDAAGRLSDAANPNGSQRHIAGILDGTGRILGLMPHPENACEQALGSTDGLKLFESIVHGLVAA